MGKEKGGNPSGCGRCMTILKSAGLRGVSVYSVYALGLKGELDALVLSNMAWKTPDKMAVFYSGGIPGGAPEVYTRSSSSSSLTSSSSSSLNLNLNLNLNMNMNDAGEFKGLRIGGRRIRRIRRIQRN
jgi:hypothetical protein